MEKVKTTTTTYVVVVGEETAKLAAPLLEHLLPGAEASWDGEGRLHVTVPYRHKEVARFLRVSIPS